MKRVNFSFTVIGAGLLLLVAAIGQHVGAMTPSGWVLDCKSQAVFTWQGTVIDADGNPVEPGDYFLVYCYYEGSDLIGCCTTSTTVAAKGSATADIKLAQPIWEDTFKLASSPTAEVFDDLWLEITVNGVVVSPRTSMTGVMAAVVEELHRTQQKLEEKVRRIDTLEAQIIELQQFKARVVTAMQTLAETIQAKQ
jgi:hypothetical protein